MITNDISFEETVFFERTPQLLPIYAALRGQLAARYPDLSIKVSKTQISFRNRHIFALASLPRRCRKERPGPYLIVSFGLERRLEDVRIAEAVEPYPQRWTHHVFVERAAEIDGHLLGWLDEAYDFSLVK